MFSFPPRKRWLIFAGIIGVCLLAVVIGAVEFLNLRLTRYFESDTFREDLEKETAKGLHFPRGQYSPIRRTALFTAQTGSFQAHNGEKALLSLEARDITAKFNPWGVLLRRWQLDELHIQSGDAEIHIYKHQPETPSFKRWFSIFLPNRVYLKRIDSDSANVTWQFRGERAGFFGTRLLITPHDRDFDYQATGGTLKMAGVPELYLRQAHLLITKKLLTLYAVDLAAGGVRPPGGLASGAQDGGSIHGDGSAGIGEDTSVDFNVSFERLPIDGWLPASWREDFIGSAMGTAHWKSKTLKLETSSGEGSLRVSNARIDNLPLLRKLPEFAQKKSLEHLRPNECSLELAWQYPKIDIENIALEEKGKFRIEGAISVDQNSLGGAIDLGVARQYLDWLPNPEQVFTQERGGYLWTTVHLSGTLEEPKQDLSPRIVDLFKESPGAYLRLIFRQFGEWLENFFGGH